SRASSRKARRQARARCSSRASSWLRTRRRCRAKGRASVVNVLGGWEEKYTEVCSKLDAITTAIEALPRSEQDHSQQLREWEPFVVYDAVTLDSNGAGTIGGSGTNLVPAGNGWEAFVHYLSVSV